MTKTANCGEHASYVQIGLHIMKQYLALKKKTLFSKIQQGYVVPGDHVFVVIDYADKTSVGVLDTWAGKNVVKTRKEFQAAEAPKGKGFYQTYVVKTFKPNPYVEAKSRIKFIPNLPEYFDPKSKEHVLAYNEGFSLLPKAELKEFLASIK